MLENPFCEIYENLFNWEAETEEGTILVTGRGTLLQHGKALYLLLLGLGGEQLLTDFGFAGPICALPTFDEGEHMELAGSTVVAVPDGFKNQKLHTTETLNPATLGSLFPGYGIFLGPEKAHLASGATGQFELVNGANWSGI